MDAKKNERFIGIQSIRGREGGRKERDLLLFNVNNLHCRLFSITLSYIFPPSSSACLPEESRTKDRREANENNKEWFFPSRQANLLAVVPLRFPLF